LRKVLTGRIIKQLWSGLFPSSVYSKTDMIVCCCLCVCWCLLEVPFKRFFKMNERDWRLWTTVGFRNLYERVSGILLEYIIVVCALFDFRMKFYDYLAVDRWKGSWWLSYIKESFDATSLLSEPGRRTGW
jgi:hypothetical protein